MSHTKLTIMLFDFFIIKQAKRVKELSIFSLVVSGNTVMNEREVTMIGGREVTVCLSIGCALMGTGFSFHFSFLEKKS